MKSPPAHVWEIRTAPVEIAGASIDRHLMEIFGLIGSARAEENAANMRLAAAAPDLLAALEAAEGIIDWALDNGAHPGVRAVHALILEAIRKAI